MFEAQVAFYLNKYLGRYLDGLDAESLRISVWKGDVSLTNLALKPEALADLELPITVRAGLLGRLTLKVPWNKLGREPVIVEFDGLYILAGPRSNPDVPLSQDMAEYDAQMIAKELESKLKRIQAAELEWIQELGQKGLSPEEQKVDAPKGGGWSVASFVEPILGNLQIRLTNLHIRYEDDTSFLGHNMALGFMFSEIGAHTVDDKGRRAFVTDNVLQCLRKAVSLAKISIYFDVDRPFLKPPDNRTWKQLTRAEWDRLFVPERHYEDGAYDNDVYPHDYLVCPVSGNMKYTRRSKKVRKGEDDPKQEMQLSLEKVGVRFSRLQYMSAQQLLQMLDTYQANAPYRHIRPRFRPKPGTASRIWWHYVFKAVCLRLHSNHVSWEELTKVARMRKIYVPLYARCIQDGKLGGNDQTAEMDKDLSEGTILLFRRMGHAKVETAKRTAAAYLLTGANPSSGTKAAKTTNRSWAGWAMGYKATPAKPGAGQGAGLAQESGGQLAHDESAEEETEQGSTSLLSPDEWAKIDELIQAGQEAKEDNSSDTPFTLQLKFGVSLQSASLLLVDDDNEQPINICAASMSDGDVQLSKYPTTLAARMVVGCASVQTPHGQLFSTGALALQHTDPSSAGAADTASLFNSAFCLDVTKSPQDGSADAIVNLLIAPSYVTYVPSAVSSIVNFFSMDRELELTTLQAQASARAEQLKRLAELQLRSLSVAEEKPKLLLKLCCHAPKVAIPDTTGRATVILDLGLFNMRSSRDLAQTLRPEEAALYECFDVQVGNMAAYIFDGAFAWPNSTPSNTPTPPPPSPGPPSRATGLYPSLNPTPAVDPAAPPPMGQAVVWDASGQQWQASYGALEWDLSEMISAQYGSQTKLVPLLERFAINVDLLVATSVHPRMPQLKLNVNATSINLQFSPFRYHRLMGVIQSVTAAPTPPSPEAADASSTTLSGAGSPAPLWFTDAEYRTKLKNLRWKGLARNKAKWSNRWLTIWRGRVFMSREKEATEALDSRTYWRGWRLLDLDPDTMGGHEFCMALAQKDIRKEDVSEHPDALVLQLPDQAARVELRRHLLRSQSTMASVAGFIDKQDDDEVDDNAAGGQGGGVGSEVGQSQDIFSSLLRHKDIFQVTGSISELSIAVSGRAAPSQSWWPEPTGTTDLSAAPPDSQATGTPASGKLSGDGSPEAFAPKAPSVSQKSTKGDAEGEGGGGGEAKGQASPSAKLAEGDSEDEGGGAPAGEASPSAKLAECAASVRLEDEVPLIVAQFNSVVVEFVYSSDRMKVTAAMRAMEIHDALVGGQDPEQGLLAYSSMITGGPAGLAAPAGGSTSSLCRAAPAKSAGSSEDTGGSSLERVPSSPCSLEGADSLPFYDAQDAQGPPPVDNENSLPVDNEDSLVSFSFTSHNMASPKYRNLDSELILRVSTLYLQCHRPTIATLMSLGSDFSAVMRLLNVEADIKTKLLRGGAGTGAGAGAVTEGSSTPLGSEGGPVVAGAESPPEAPRSASGAGGSGGGSNAGGSVDDQEGAVYPQSSVVSFTDPDNDADDALVRKGGQERTVTRLILEMKKLEVVLCYEGSDINPLCISSVDDFQLQLDVHPATMELSTKLGNAVTTYTTLPEDSPYRTICALKPGTTGSLIELFFKIHSRDESYNEPRVPDGLQFYSLNAALSQVRLVFMQRFLNEALAYINVLLSMQLPAVVLPAWVEAKCVVLQEAMQQEQQLLLQKQSGRTQSAAAPSPAKPTAGAAASPLQAAMVLLLDVSLNAPVITMPESSESSSGIELDLGSIELHNHVEWVPFRPSRPAHPDGGSRAEVGGGSGAAVKMLKVLTDDMTIKLSQMSAIIIKGGKDSGSSGAGSASVGAGAGRNGSGSSSGGGAGGKVSGSGSGGGGEGSKEGGGWQSVRGENLIRDLGDGISLRVQRALCAAPASGTALAPTRPAGPAPKLPPMQVSIIVPAMSACITDVEYRLLLSILSTNIVEQSKLPLELVTLSEQVLAAAEAHRQRIAAAGTQGTAPQGHSGGGASAATAGGNGDGSNGGGGGGGAEACSPRGGEQAETRRAQSSRSGLRPACDFSLPLAQLLRTLGDSCTMKATVEVKHAQLQLLLEQPDGKPPVALTCVGLSDYFISYHATEQRNMFVSIHMPSVSIEDLRPGVAAEHSLVLSTADVGAVQPICNSQDRHNHASGDEGEAPPWDKDAAPLTPSLMVFEYRAVRGRESEPDDPALTQALRMRMQKPTMVVDLRFFMTVLNFVAPQPMLQGAVPREFSSRELFLGPEPYQMDEDLWLSPEFRVLADAPGTSHFLLDGCGCSLVLPPHIPSSEMLPLIMVGADKSLELRNVTILNSDSLASCLSLAPGARLIARAEDGVSMVLACSPETDTTLALRARSSRASLAANSASGLVPDGLGASSPSHASMAANSTTTSVPLGPSARRASLPLRGVSMTAPSMTDAAAPAPASGVALHVHLDALGVNLHVVDSLSNAPASSDTRDINGGKAAISRAGSNMSMGVLGSMGRQPSRASLPIASTMKWTKSSRLGPASAVPASMQALHRLVLSMDLSASFQSETGSQLAAASIRGLTIKTHSYSMARSSLLPGSMSRAPLMAHCESVSSLSVSESGSIVGDSAASAISSASPARVSRKGSCYREGGEAKANACDPIVVQSSVLDPCDVSVSFKESPDKVEFSLDLSDISMKLSPDVMNHLLKLQNAVAMPLVLPPQDQPLSRCSKFEQLWSSAQSESSFGYATLGQGGVESMAEFRGVTLWRPQPPSGYIILGDMPVAGSNQPTHQVVTVAINSGLVAYPLGYVLVWEGEEVALWRPTPPAGYVAMGCVATASPDTPPSTKLVGCLHKRCVVEARVGDCLLLSSDGNLWCVQNSCSTLQVSAPEVHLPEVAMYDLRSPLGVPPVAATSDATLLEAAAGITNPASIKALDASDFRSTLDDTPPDAGAGADAVTGEQPLSGLTPAPAANLAEEQPVYPLSLLAQKRFLEHRKEIITSVTSRRHIATTVEFQLLWWDKHSAQPSLTQVSFWRPKPPPGYVSLGDCMVTEVYCPPQQGALVLRDVDPGQALTDGKPPQLAKPIGFVQSWYDEQHAKLGDGNFLSIWRPVPPAGYVPVSMVVGLGPQPPSTNVMRCVRADMVFSNTLSRTAPNWIHPPFRQRSGLYGWVIDERASTFIISVQSEPTATSSGKSRSGKGSGGTLEAWSVRLNDDADDKEEPEGPKKKAAHKPMDMSVSSGQVVVLLRDNMSQPIMELGAQNIKMIVGCQTPGVFRGYVFVTASVWSYNALISSWEPVVEPWQVLLHIDQNTHSRQCEGVAPGTWLKLTSTQGYVHVTIAHSACQNVIASAQEWAAALGDSDSTYPRSMPMVGADSAATMLGLCENTLGIPCDMLLDYGDHQEIVRLPPGERIPVNQPQVQAPAGYLASAAARGVERSSSSGRGGSGRSKGGEANAAHVTFPNSLRLLVDVLRCTAASSAPQPQGRGGSGKSVALISHSDGTNEVLGSEQPAGGPPVGAVSSDPPSCLLDDELKVLIKIRGRLSALMPESAWGVATRSVAPSPSSKGGRSVAEWHERFVVRLPEVLSEALLLPHIAGSEETNQFAGSPLQFEFQLFSGSKEGGLGAYLGSCAAILTFDWMASQVDLLQMGPVLGQTSADVDVSNTHAGMLLDLDVLPPPKNSESNDAPEPVNPQAAVATLQARLSFDPHQMDASWRAALLQRKGASSTKTLGRRALRLVGQGDRWAPFGVKALMGQGRGNLSEVVPIPAGKGVAMESGVNADGQRVDVLRSLCVLSNSSSLPLEVSLVFNSNDVDWTVVPTVANRDGSVSEAAVVEEEVFENERAVKSWSDANQNPRISWSHANLNSAERHRYNRRQGQDKGSMGFPLIPLPPNWEWEGSWHVEKHGHVDKDGWAYASAWEKLDYPFAPGCGAQKSSHMLRRRRWTRRRRLLSESEAAAAIAASTAGSLFAMGECENEGGIVRRTLGYVMPGDRLPLPMGWDTGNCDLQVRPAALIPNNTDVPGGEIYADVDTPLQRQDSGAFKYNWSKGLSLDTMAEEAKADTFLVQSRNVGGSPTSDFTSANRPPPGTSEQHPAEGQLVETYPGSTQASMLAMQPLCWFSLMSDCDPLVSAQGMDNVSDWHVDVRPPLKVHNAMPVVSHFIVWERPSSSNSLKLRQRGRIAAGDTAHVYTADMREQVLLSFWPDGCEYSESEPIIISEGISANTSGVTNPPSLPDSFRCSYVNSAASTQLRVYLRRIMDLSSCPDIKSDENKSMAQKVGRGTPLLIRIFVPLWVVNATQLPINIGVVALESEQTHSSFMEGSSDGSTSAPHVAPRPVGAPGAAAGGLGNAHELRLVDTEAFTSSPKPTSGSITILPRSMELLSWSLFSDTHYGIALSMMGSRWSAPLSLPGAQGMVGGGMAAGGSAAAAAAAGTMSYEPIIIRARSKPDGTIQEVVARIESAGLGFQNSLVLRLDVHMVVSNRTGYNLQLIQPESGSSSGGKPKSTPSSDPSGLNRGASETMDPYAHRWKQAATFNLPAGAVGTPLHWAPTVSRRLLCLSLPGITDASLPVAPDASKMSMSQAAAVAQAAAKARSVALETQTAAGSESSACEGGGQLGWYATGDAPATASTSYLPDQKAASMHRQVSSRGGGWLLWSEPFRMEYPGGIEMQVVLPVYCMGEVGSIPDDDPITRRDSGGGTLTPPYGEAVEAARKVFMKYALSAAAPGLTGPSFVRVAKETEAGPLEFLAVVVHLSISIRVTGCLHLVMHTIGGEAQQLIQNLTSHPLRFRENVPRALWCTLKPFSAQGYARQYTLDGASLEVELKDAAPATLEQQLDAASDSDIPVVLSFDPEMEGGASGGTRSSSKTRNGGAGAASGTGSAISTVIKLGMPAEECLAQVTDVLEVTMCPGGLSHVQGAIGASLGATHLDLLMRVVPRPPAIGYKGVPRAPMMLALTEDLAQSGSQSGIYVCVNISGLELSVVDQRPQELLLFTFDGLYLEHHMGSVAGVQYVKTLAKLRNIQIDDMLFNSPHPVLALPVDANRADSASGDLMFLMQVSEPNRRRGVMCMPSIVLRALPLRLSLSEALLWRLYSFGDTLQSALSRSVLDSSTAGSHPPGNLQRSDPANGSVAHTTTKQVSADLPLQVDLLNVEDLNLRLSFKPNASVRPRYFSQFMSLGMDFANLEDLPLTLPGIEAHQVREQRSMLISQAVNRLQQRIFSIALSVLKNYGVMGATSKILAAASHGITSLVDNSNSQAVQVGNIGDGVLEGGKAFAKGIFHGAKGIVAKPIKGASDGGFQGFFSGLGKGFIGAATAPVSGALAAASKVTEGMDATYSTMRSFVSSAPRRSGRKRLPRHFTGDRILEPFNLDMALGQALLQSACYPVSNSIHGMVSSSVGKLSRTESSMDPDQGPAFNLDLYEHHTVLPNKLVLMTTNIRLCMLLAPEFVVLQQLVLTGELTHVTDVPGGTIVWQLPWEDLLTVDLAWHKQQPGIPPDGLIIHRKRRGEKDGAIVYDVRCQVGANQAAELHPIIQSCRHRFFVKPRQEIISWKEQQIIPSRTFEGQARPDTMLSAEWKLVWYSSKQLGPRTSLSAKGGAVVGGLLGGGKSSVSIWRPTGVPGYAMLGDVAVIGTEPPPRPVRMYKDILNSDSDSPIEGPRLLPPTGYVLLLRDSAHPPFTLWKPVPPKGYCELGCVAWPDIEEPPLDLVRCMRRDLVTEALTYDAPIWSGASSDNSYWRCSIWEVDNHAGTFLATKTEQRPHRSVSRAPLY